MVHEIARPSAEERAGAPMGDAETAMGSRDWAPGFIEALCRALDDEGIRWLVLRNHEDLPDRAGHDVDILVHPEDDPRIDRLVRRVARECGLFLLRAYRGVEHHTFDVAASDLRGRLLLHLDVQTALRYRGRLLIDAEDLLVHRRGTAGNMWALEPGMEAYALLMHTALHKGELKDKYAHRLETLEEGSPGALLPVAMERLGPALGGRLASVRTESQLLSLRKELGRSVDRRYPSNLWKRPWFNVRSGAAMTRLRLRPRGVFVVFLGPDGSGKSSTTDLLVEMLNSRTKVLPVHRVYMGSGTPWLPTRKLARWVHGRTGSRERNRQQVRDVRPRRLRGALHVMADEILRYWVHVRPRLAGHGIVLADRYAYDLFRINNPTVRRRWFRRAAAIVIPAPNLTFFLEGNPEVITARKQELTVEETIRQQHAYRGLIDVVPDLRPLDLTTRDEAALRRVALEILDAYSVRNHGFPSDGTGRPPIGGRRRPR